MENFFDEVEEMMLVPAKLKLKVELEEFEKNYKPLRVVEISLKKIIKFYENGCVLIKNITQKNGI